MIDYLKKGFILANRNLQLVFIRITVTIINIFGLLVFLGLPVALAVTFLGYEIIHAQNLLPYFMERPHEFLSRYLGFIIFLGISVICYLIFVSVMIIYTLGGTLGVLKNSAVDAQCRFSLSFFFREANKNFSHLFWLLSLESLIFTGLFIVFLIAGITSITSLHGFSDLANFTEIFFSSFALLSIAVFSIITFAAYLVIMIISVIVSTIEGGGSGDTLKKTFVFLRKNPQAVLLTLLLFVGLIAMNIGFFTFKFSLNLIPLFFPGGIVLSIISAVLQNYLAVIAWGCLIVYYTEAANISASSKSYEI